MKYLIKVDDNFHYMDESERSDAGGFENAEAAVKAAREIVDKSLLHLYREGMTADELYEYYQDFGDDPFIVTDDQNCQFSAWRYAEQKCREICPPEASK
jgi:hypothetical protein